MNVLAVSCKLFSQSCVLNNVFFKCKTLFSVNNGCLANFQNRLPIAMKSHSTNYFYKSVIRNPNVTCIRHYSSIRIREQYNSPQTVSKYMNITYRCFHNQHVFNAKSTLREIDVNTKVGKDVILFRYDNPRFYRILNIFAICQFLFWGYLAHFAFTTLKDVPVNKDSELLPLWRRINLGDNKYRNAITALCLVIGYGILALAWIFTLKSVRFLILRKGGESVTFVTYGPFGKNRMMTVNLNKVSCEESRHNSKVQLPIKVENFRLFFMLDMRGEFTNARLFDHTAGLQRFHKT